jgi:GMP synthase-like glutamine amidotransferase
MAKHISSRPKFYSQSVEQDYKPTPSIANEVIVNTKKELVQTEMLVNLKSNNFLAWNPTTWKIHPHSFIDPAKKYKILAESMESPQIIELKNAVGCLFTFENKYPATWTILENFIQKSMNSIWDCEAIGNQGKELVSE